MPMTPIAKFLMVKPATVKPLLGIPVFGSPATQRPTGTCARRACGDRSTPCRYALPQLVFDAAEVVCGQPEAQQVPPPRLVVEIVVRLTRVQNHGVVEELDVAGLKVHRDVELGIV